MRAPGSEAEFEITKEGEVFVSKLSLTEMNTIKSYFTAHHPYRTPTQRGYRRLKIANIIYFGGSAIEIIIKLGIGPPGPNFRTSSTGPMDYYE